MSRAALLGIAAGAGAYLVLRSSQAAAAAYESGDYLAGPFDLEAPPGDVFDSIVGAVDEFLGGGVEEGGMNEGGNVAAFCHMVRVAEHGRDDESVYFTLFGGGRFTGTDDHPRIPVTAKIGGRSITSTAAGAYQALSRTWDDFIRARGPHDFSPASQDEFALWCIRRRGALRDVEAGRFGDAVRKCAKEWASLPGSPYGQPTISLDRAFALFEQGGGVVA